MNDNAKAWVAALRSGQYTQGQDYLAFGSRYCCLGVACALYVETYDDLEVTFRDDWTVYGGRELDLPDKVRDWLGLNSRLGDFQTEEDDCMDLAQLNDDEMSFADIADLIESEPAGLFTNGH